MAKAGTVYVDVEADTSKFISKLNSEARKAGQSLTSGLGSVGRTVMSDLITSAGAAAQAVGAIGVVSAGVGIKTASELETATLQFETLLGSAEEAEERVASLFEFAKRTPFETGPIIKASRLLQTFGGDALAAEGNLTLVGDAAAATSQPIDELAFWVGRAYSQIKGGQPFGEAAMRLQELAVLSPEARSEMERLQETGASSTEVWAVLEGQLGKFSGAMQKMAGTMAGLTSTLADMFSLTSADVFAPLFESTKRAMGALVEFGETPAFESIVSHLQSLVAAGVGHLDRIIDKVGEFLSAMTPGDVDAFFGRLTGLAGEAAAAVEGLGPVISGVGVALSSMALRSIPLLGSFVPAISPITGALAGLLLGSDESRAALGELGSMLSGIAREQGPALGRALGDLAGHLAAGLGGALSAVTPSLERAAEIIGPVLVDAITTLGPPLGQLVESLGELAAVVIPDVAAVIARIAPAVTGVLAAGLDVMADLIGLVADNSEIAIPAIAGLFGVLAAHKLFTTVGTLKQIGTHIWALGQQAAAAVREKGLGGLVSMLGSGLGVAAIGAGAAIAGVVGVLQWQAREAEEAARTTRRYRDAIEEVGSVTVGTEQALGDWLSTLEGHEADEIADVVDVMDQMGLSVSDLAGKFALGDDAWGAFRDQFEAAAMDAEAAALGFDSYADALENDSTAAGIAKSRAEDLGNALAKQRDGANEAEESQDQLNEVLGAGAEAANRLEGAIQALNDQFESLIGVQRSAEEAELRYNDAQARVIENAMRAGTIVDANGQLTQQFREDQLAATEALFAFAEAEVQVTGDTGRANEIIGAHIAQLRGVLTQAGLTEAQIVEYLRTLGLTPEQVDTLLRLWDAEAKKRVQDWVNRLEGISEEELTKIQALIDHGSLAEAEAALNTLSRTRYVNLYVQQHMINPGLPFAKGGIVEFFQSGGLSEHHIAQIAAPGVTRVWNEPEAGGEAYIPLGGDRGRNLAIWAEVGRRLGVAADRMAGRPGVSIGTLVVQTTETPRRWLDEALWRVA